MNGTSYIPIFAHTLRRAADLARQCSSTAVRERVLISHAAALALREHLHGTAPHKTEDGRSSLLKYVELLDICDFRVGNRQIEVRAMTTVERMALYVPTMPMMVGVLS